MWHNMDNTCMLPLMQCINCVGRRAAKRVKELTGSPATACACLSMRQTTPATRQNGRRGREMEVCGR